MSPIQLIIIGGLGILGLVAGYFVAGQLDIGVPGSLGLTVLGGIIGAVLGAIIAAWLENRESAGCRTASSGAGRRGNPQAAARRLRALGGIAILPITEAAVELSAALLHGRALPTNAQNDAIHIGVSAVHGVDYLLIWNFRHLSNAETRRLIRSVCERQGFTSPETCTPSELIGGLGDV